MIDLTWSMCWLPELLTFLLKTESICEFCKSIFKIYHALSKLSVDCLFLFNECMQCFLKISSRRWSIRRCISMRILEIMVCLKRWLWSLCIIVITLPTEIWVISPTRVICLWVWVMIGLPWKKAWACSWRHSLKESKVGQSLVECSLVSQIWHTISWTYFKWPTLFQF